MKTRMEQFTLIAVVLAGIILGGHTYASAIPTSGLTLWLKADSITGLSSGDPVPLWNDSSANGMNVSQVTSSLQPLWYTNVIHNRPVVRFDGGDVLTRSSVPGSSLFSADQTTIFIVQRQDGSKIDATTLNFSAPNSANMVELHLTYYDYLYFDYGDIGGGGRLYNAEPAGWDNTFHSIEAYRPTSGTSTITMDGSTVLSGTFTDTFDPAPTSTLVLGAEDASAFHALKGDIAEVIIYNRALTGDERLAVNNYLYETYFLPEPSVAGLMLVGGALLRWRRRVVAAAERPAVGGRPEGRGRRSEVGAPLCRSGQQPSWS